MRTAAECRLKASEARSRIDKTSEEAGKAEWRFHAKVWEDLADWAGRQEVHALVLGR